MTINDHQNIKQKIKTDKQIGDDFVCAPEDMQFLIHFHTVSANHYFYHYYNISNGIDAKQIDNKIILSL